MRTSRHLRCHLLLALQARLLLLLLPHRRQWVGAAALPCLLRPLVGHLACLAAGMACWVAGVMPFC
jgi:hypothetical protein